MKINDFGFQLSEEDLERGIAAAANALDRLENIRTVRKFKSSLSSLSDKEATTWLFVNKGIKLSVEEYQRIKSEWEV